MLPVCRGAFEVAVISSVMTSGRRAGMGSLTEKSEVLATADVTLRGC